MFLVSSCFFIILICLVPCGRLSWLLVSFWAHVNIVHHIISYHVQTSWNVLYLLTVTVACFSSDDRALRYVLPVLWMTSCFPIMGRIARGVGNNDVGAVLKQVVKISNAFARGRHAVWLCRRILSQQMVHRGRSVMSTTGLFYCLRFITRVSVVSASLEAQTVKSHLWCVW